MKRLSVNWTVITASLSPPLSLASNRPVGPYGRRSRLWEYGMGRTRPRPWRCARKRTPSAPAASTGVSVVFIWKPLRRGKRRGFHWESAFIKVNINERKKYLGNPFKKAASKKMQWKMTVNDESRNTEFFESEKNVTKNCACHELYYIPFVISAFKLWHEVIFFEQRRRNARKETSDERTCHLNSISKFHQPWLKTMKKRGKHRHFLGKVLKLQWEVVFSCDFLIEIGKQPMRFVTGEKNNYK